MALGPCLSQFEFVPAFENKNYTAYDRVHGIGSYGETGRPRKNQSERSDFSYDYLAIK